eukprot:10109867-Ditylum_brightwellii.AAC.1
MRRTLLKEQAKALEIKGEGEEAQKVHNMIANKKERARAQRLARIKRSEMKSGIISAQAEEVATDVSGKTIYNQDGSEKVVTHTITEQKELEKACMKEVNRRSQMSKETPPMTSPLVNHLGYT